MQNKIRRVAHKSTWCALLLSGALVGCSTTSTPEGVMPAVSHDGLTLIKETRSTVVYKKAAVDFGAYSTIQIQPSQVAFKKDWQRDYNRSAVSLSDRISDKDVSNIKTVVSQLFDEVFSTEFGEVGGYPLVQTPEKGTLLLRPFIINLDVYAPDINSSTRGRTYVESTGQATLYLEIYDGVSGEILARVSNAQEAGDNGYHQWANRVTNRADAKRVMKKWAQTLRVSFDKAQGKEVK